MTKFEPENVNERRIGFLLMLISAAAMGLVFNFLFR